MFPSESAMPYFVHWYQPVVPFERLSECSQVTGLFSETMVVISDTILACNSEGRSSSNFRPINSSLFFSKKPQQDLLTKVTEVSGKKRETRSVWLSTTS